jgi:hypothetical protein
MGITLDYRGDDRETKGRGGREQRGKGGESGRLYEKKRKGV